MCASHVVWFDVTDEDEIVPLFEGSIVIKATRLHASAAKYLKTKKSSQNASKPSPAQRVSNNAKPVKPSQTTSETPKSKTSTPSEERTSASPVSTADFLDSFVAVYAVE